MARAFQFDVGPVVEQDNSPPRTGIGNGPGPVGRCRSPAAPRPAPAPSDRVLRTIPSVSVIRHSSPIAVPAHPALPQMPAMHPTVLSG